MIQIDIVGKLTATPYAFILTAFEVFTRYLFAIPLIHVSAKSVAQALFGIFMRHAYLPTTILCDLGIAFNSALMQEFTALLEVELSHASVKHPQSIGLLERSHSALKRIFKINENQNSMNWCRYADIALFVYNTTYNTSIGCTPSLLCHAPGPYTPG